MAASDDQAFAACFQRYYPLIRHKCARMLHSREEADDVAQETFIRLWQQRDKDNVRDATAWVYRTSTRLAIDLLRQKKRRPTGEAELRVDSTIERQLDHRAWLQRVAALLPEKELEVAILSRVDRLQQSEIAQVLNCSERTVRRLLSSLDEHLKASVLS